MNVVVYQATTRTQFTTKVLVGTSDSINAVVADEFKLVNISDADVTNNTAAKLRLHTTAITGQTDLTSGSPVSDPANDLLDVCFI